MIAWRSGTHAPGSVVPFSKVVLAEDRDLSLNVVVFRAGGVYYLYVPPKNSWMDCPSQSCADFSCEFPVFAASYASLLPGRKFGS